MSSKTNLRRKNTAKRHRISAARDIADAETRRLARRAIRAALKHMAAPCFVRVFCVTDKEIAALNVETRGINAPTDVLSFPNFDIAAGEHPVFEADETRCFLGEIAVSLRRARSQARAYGHGFERELSFLCVHGALHLLGYDHKTPSDEQKMKQKAYEILDRLGLSV